MSLFDAKEQYLRSLYESAPHGFKRRRYRVLQEYLHWRLRAGL